MGRNWRSCGKEGVDAFNCCIWGPSTTEQSIIELLSVTSRSTSTLFQIKFDKLTIIFRDCDKTLPANVVDTSLAVGLEKTITPRIRQSHIHTYPVIIPLDHFKYCLIFFPVHQLLKSPWASKSAPGQAGHHDINIFLYSKIINLGITLPRGSYPLHRAI